MGLAMPEPEFERCEVYYSGRVQGVGFRYTAQHIAGGFHVTGFVQNVADGRVLLVAEGAPDELDRLLAAIQRQMGRYIRHITHSRGPSSGEFSRFEVRF
jgi:acylphosphatase